MYLTNILVVVVVLVVIKLLSNETRKSATKKTENKSSVGSLYKMSKVGLFAGAGMVVVSLVLILVPVLFATLNDDFFIYIYSSIIFGILGLLVLCMSYNRGIYIDESSISNPRLFRSPIVVEWNEISEIDFNTLTHDVILKSKTKRVKISMYLIGFYELLVIVRERIYVEFPTIIDQRIDTIKNKSLVASSILLDMHKNSK